MDTFIEGIAGIMTCLRAIALLLAYDLSGIRWLSADRCLTGNQKGGSVKNPIKVPVSSPLNGTSSFYLESGSVTSPVCPCGRSVSGTGCKNVQIPAHVFEIPTICCFSSEISILLAGKCTLTDAFGWRNIVYFDYCSGTPFPPTEREYVRIFTG